MHHRLGLKLSEAKEVSSREVEHPFQPQTPRSAPGSLAAAEVLASQGRFYGAPASRQRRAAG